jgi:hypothetical protein
MINPKLREHLRSTIVAKNTGVRFVAPKVNHFYLRERCRDVMLECVRRRAALKRSSYETGLALLALHLNIDNGEKPWLS